LIGHKDDNISKKFKFLKKNCFFFLAIREIITNLTLLCVMLFVKKHILNELDVEFFLTIKTQEPPSKKVG
jgi:hypothetical protein